MATTLEPWAAHRSRTRLGHYPAWQGELTSPGSDHARWVQTALNRVLGVRLPVTGVIDLWTRSAIRSFQTRAGLKADGIVGPRTTAALRRAGAPPAPAPGRGPGLEPIHPERDRGAVRPTATGRAALPSGCPEPARKMEDRCLHPGTHQCPAIPNLLCLTQVGDVPFEYPTKYRRDSATGVTVVQSRQANRRQRFVPPVHVALQQFIANSRRFGLPFEAILTAGSLYCRCISKTDKPSNHSFGDAIDIVGVRWPPVGGPASRFRETIVHNFRDSEQRALLRRLNACLRLSFATVIDYHDSRHHDHFHCDMNRGRGRTFGPIMLRFVQEALTVVLNRPVPITGRLDPTTKQGLKEFARAGDEVWSDRGRLAQAIDQLCTRIAAGR